MLVSFVRCMALLTIPKLCNSAAIPDYDDPNPNYPLVDISQGADIKLWADPTTAPVYVYQIYGGLLNRYHMYTMNEVTNPFGVWNAAESFGPGGIYLKLFMNQRKKKRVSSLAMSNITGMPKSKGYDWEISWVGFGSPWKDKQKYLNHQWVEPLALTGAPVDWVWGTTLGKDGMSIFGNFNDTDVAPCENSLFKNSTLCNMHWQRRCNMPNSKCRREINRFDGRELDQDAAAGYAAMQRSTELVADAEMRAHFARVHAAEAERKANEPKRKANEKARKKAYKEAEDAKREAEAAERKATARRFRAEMDAEKVWQQRHKAPKGWGLGR